MPMQELTIKCDKCGKTLHVELPDNKEVVGVICANCYDKPSVEIEEPANMINIQKYWEEFFKRDLELPKD